MDGPLEGIALIYLESRKVIKIILWDYNEMHKITGYYTILPGWHGLHLEEYTEDVERSQALKYDVTIHTLPHLKCFGLVSRAFN